MKRLLLALALPLAPLSAQGIPQPASIPPAPPPPGPGQALVVWMPGQVRCGGDVLAEAPVRPASSSTWAGPNSQKPVTYAFEIDATGRPLGIARDGSDYSPFAEDIAPSLAATRFAAGTPRTRCSLAYTPRQTLLADTPVADLMDYAMNARPGTLPKAGWDRIYPAGTCRDEPRPQPLRMVYPDFRAIPAQPGRRDWTMLSYDTAANGVPKNVRTIGGDGNHALDSAGAKALASSRFTEGPRAGCIYSYYQSARTLAAPPMPEEASFRSPTATCPKQIDWAIQPRLTFPEAYNRRSIEGWAIVSYDLASWGATGNIRVLASQPSGDFGRQAAQLIAGARAAPSTSGAIGCVDHVRYVIHGRDAPATAD